MSTINLSKAIQRTFGVVEERYEQGGVDYVGIPTGFFKLDKYLGGLREQAVYVVGARTAMGKSAFAITLGMNVARQQKKVLYLSFEMSSSLVALRILSGATQLPSDDIERGRLTPQQIKKLKGVADDLSGMSFAIYDDVTTSDDVVDYVKEFQDQYGLDLLIIDYIALFRDKGTNEVNRLGSISNNINAIATMCNIPVVLLAQLNREVDKRENHTPVLSDLRASGDIEQDAFSVIFLTRPHYYAMMEGDEEEVTCESDAEIIIAKNRQGATGKTKARYYPKEMRWEQPPPELTPPPVVNRTPPPQVEEELPKTLAEKVRRGR